VAESGVQYDMPSRRKRKRERRKAEATANAPASKGGWGQGVPTRLSDLVLLRRSINEDWPIPAPVRQAIVDELGAELGTPDLRRTASILRAFLAMERANLREARRQVEGE
jgi:hypothetical protein